jgi:glycosyltransferase involved in cell wall biosynthesis
MIPARGVSPKVSIGMPIRNGGYLLPKALRSVFEQTEQNIEIIVSDNGSDDGSSEVLQAAAAADARVRYMRQDPPISAYDNFHFVLRQARGDYFMWAAHDDTRDADFVARLAAALERDSGAVMAFGDLQIVTPGDSVGAIVPFPFQTVGMGRLARLAKLSRLQCYYIYGLWRTAAIRRVPYAYCDWWADLPLMLAAAMLGTFVHVPGTRFHYLEVPKTNLGRVQVQDYSERFNLVGSVAGLVAATYRACAPVGGRLAGAYAAALVILKQAVNLPGYVSRRVGLTRAAHSVIR